MYYPIIDKLKDVMAEIGQGGGGALVIEGVQTSDAGGTWTGSFSDIINALTNGTPCILKFVSSDNNLFNIYISAVSESFNMAAGAVGSTNYVLNPNNTFVIN